MKAIILGAGVIGGYAAQCLVGFNELTEVCIADINEQNAKEYAQTLGSMATYKQVDIYTPQQLRQSLRGYDVVVNCVGPFYKNADLVIKAAIDEKVNFVDICDDYDAAELLLSYNEECKTAGITAIICAGASPGMMNIFAAIGASKMQQAEEIDTSWIENSIDAVGAETVFYHAAHFVDGLIPQFLDGKQVNVPALSGKEEFDFPAIGKYPVYFVGHPEPVTIPRFIKGLKKVTNRGNGYPLSQDYKESFLGFLAQLGFTSKDIEVNVKGNMITPRDFLCSYLPIVLSSELPEEFEVTDVENMPHFITRVDVKGYNHGQPAQIIYFSTCEHTKIATGGTSAYIARLIVNGSMKTKGVMGPEACVESMDQNNYFKYMKEHGVTMSEVIKTETELGVSS